MTYNFAAAGQQQIAWLWSPPDPQPVQPNSFDGTTYGTVPHAAPYVPPVIGNSPRNVSQYGAIPTYLTYPTTTGGITPQAAVTSVVAVGGQAVVAIVGPCNGGQIFNGNAAQQGVSAENLNADFTGPCLAGDANARGTTFLIATSTSYTLPGPLAPGVQLWVNASSSNHHFTTFVW